MIINNLKQLQASFISLEEKSKIFEATIFDLKKHFDRQGLSYGFKNRSFYFSCGFRSNTEGAFKILFGKIANINGYKVKKPFKVTKFHTDQKVDEENQELDEILEGPKDKALPIGTVREFQDEKSKPQYLFEVENYDLDYNDLMVQVRVYYMKVRDVKVIKIKPYLLNERMEVIVK
mgnify:CR=1 FL=1